MSVLDPDLAEVARALLADPLLDADTHPDLLRAAMRGRDDLVAFFRTELRWRVEVDEVARVVRLHKRRVDPPTDRGPTLVRRDASTRKPASAGVLVLFCLACEQLWRRPRMSVQELQQALAQVCAAEAEQGTLPRFVAVAADGTDKAVAHRHRRDLVDALLLAESYGLIETNRDLEVAAVEQDASLIVTASRARLAVLFASPPPTLVHLDDRDPAEHAAVLATEVALDRDDVDADVEDRRLNAVRRLIDDPGTDPAADASAVAYLRTPAGRDRALAVLTVVGLTPTVRRDWWEVTDPSGTATGTTFPNGRRNERQAALVLLAAVQQRPNPEATITLDDAAAVLTAIREQLPGWARSYHGRFPALARAALDELAGAGIVSHVDADTWKPTPAIHLWRVRVAGLPDPTDPTDPTHPTPDVAAEDSPTGAPR